MDTEPESVSVADIRVCEVLQALVCAKLVTVMVWLPATAVVAAEVRARMLVSELEPSIDASGPSKLVRAPKAVDKDDKSLPKVENAISFAAREINWFSHGVSTA